MNSQSQARQIYYDPQNNGPNYQNALEQLAQDIKKAKNTEKINQQRSALSRLLKSPKADQPEGNPNKENKKPDEDKENNKEDNQLVLSSQFNKLVPPTKYPDLNDKLEKIFELIAKATTCRNADTLLNALLDILEYNQRQMLAKINSSHLIQLIDYANLLKKKLKVPSASKVLRCVEMMLSNQTVLGITCRNIDLLTFLFSIYNRNEKKQNKVLKAIMLMISAKEINVEKKPESGNFKFIMVLLERVVQIPSDISYDIQDKLLSDIALWKVPELIQEFGQPTEFNYLLAIINVNPQTNSVMNALHIVNQICATKSMLPLISIDKDIITKIIGHFGSDNIIITTYALECIASIMATYPHQLEYIASINIINDLRDLIEKHKCLIIKQEHIRCLELLAEIIVSLMNFSIAEIDELYCTAFLGLASQVTWRIMDQYSICCWIYNGYVKLPGKLQKQCIDGGIIKYLCSVFRRCDESPGLCHTNEIVFNTILRLFVNFRSDQLLLELKYNTQLQKAIQDGKVCKIGASIQSLADTVSSAINNKIVYK